MHKKTSSLFVFGIVVTAGLAHANNIPPQETAQNAVIPGDSAKFIKSTATFAVSANVSVNWNQDATQFAVSTAVSKGMHTFGASSTIAISVFTCETSSVSAPQPSPANLGTNGCH